MDTRTNLAFLFGLGAALVGALAITNYTHWIAGVTFFIFIAFTATAYLWIEDKTRCPRLRQLFDPDSAEELYRRLIRRPAHWPRDWRMYDWALRLAVSYPLASALVTWASGYPVEIGGRVLIAGQPEAWRRAATICGLAASVLLMLSSAKIGTAARKGFVRRLSGRLNAVLSPDLVESVAGTFAVAVAVAVASAFAVAGASAVVGTFAVAGASAVVGTFAVAGAFVVAVFALWRAAGRHGKTGLFYVMLSLVLVLLLAAVVALIDWDAIPSELGAVWFLFLGVLPLLNALFDYLSYIITFSLLRAGYDRPALAPWLGLLDLVVAFVLFALCGAGIVLTIVAVNHFANVPLYPLLPLFDGIGNDPPAYWWIYLMLFSTLLPTFLHFSVAVFAMGAWLPSSWRAWIQRGVGVQQPLPAALVPLLVGFWATFSLLAPLLVIGGVVYALSQFFFPHPFEWYLGLLKGVAEWAELSLEGWAPGPTAVGD